MHEPTLRIDARYQEGLVLGDQHRPQRRWYSHTDTTETTTEVVQGASGATQQAQGQNADAPVPSHNKEKEQSPPILVTTYLRLLGLMMHLTKSRPDIMAAVPFGATKSTNPTEEDYQQLYYIVDYLRVTASKGHRIFVHIIDSSIQLYCEVDTSYQMMAAIPARLLRSHG